MPTSLPDGWVWDDYDMLVESDAARKAEIIHDQIDTLAPEAFERDPVDAQ